LEIFREHSDLRSTDIPGRGRDSGRQFAREKKGRDPRAGTKLVADHILATKGRRERGFREISGRF